MRRGERWRSDMLALMTVPAGDSELVQIMDAALEEAARRAGPWLACRPGCTQCCHGAFAINTLDAARLATGMATLRAEQPEQASRLEARAHAWIAAHGAEYPGDLQTGRLGDSEEEQERFADFANDAACPALDPETGVCEVYTWRPMTCRVFGPPVRSVGEDGAEGLGYCELCFIGAAPEQVAACEMPVPHDREAALLARMPAQGETVVAFALLR